MFVSRLVVPILLSCTFLFGQAQSTSGDIRGSVVDPSGAAIANAKVTVTDPDRGITRTTTSNNDGAFAVPLLPPGRYRLRAEAPGFSVKILEGIEVRVGDTLAIAVPMAVGQVTAEVL